MSVLQVISQEFCCYVVGLSIFLVVFDHNGYACAVIDWFGRQVQVKFQWLPSICVDWLDRCFIVVGSLVLGSDRLLSCNQCSLDPRSSCRSPFRGNQSIV